MRIRLLIIFSLLLTSFSISSVSYGQVFGTSIFVPGNYVEVGVAPNGSWGGNGTAHAGYHPYTGWNNIASVYNWQHNATWTGGAPGGVFGDYTYPGTPFEGWSMQANGARSDAFFTTGAGIGASFFNQNAGVSGLTGANTTYTNTGGTATGVWAGNTTGTSGGLSITQSTRVDANASWIVTTVQLTNTSAAAIPGVYYWRTYDPDNDETYSGNFATNNKIVYQNDVDHRVMVSATGTMYTNVYIALGTKDCRAKSMIYTNWASYPATGAANTLDEVYNQSATGWLGACYYGLGQTTTNQDIAVGLIYDIGTIPAGSSAYISFATMYDGNLYPATDIDSAFPEPLLIVNGVSIPPAGPAPDSTVDTFNACLYPGLTTLPVNINFASDKVWTGSTWTWSPTTGLSSTTGVTNSINLASLPPSITYTITGTNPAACGARTMYLTVLTCNGATVNSPCLGGALDFNAPGDSTGATYSWYGPAPSTAVVGTTQSFTITPSVWADTGTYHVIKTVGSVSDTSLCVVTIHPIPVLVASSNSPLCAGAVDTLRLDVTSTVTPATYSWSGPAGFTSTLQNPTINGFTFADSGTYYVTVTSSYGCIASTSTHVSLLPPPGPPIITDPNPYCQGAPPIPFSINATGTVYWYPSATGVGGSTTIPAINTSVAGSTTYYFNQSIGNCISPIDSITIVVTPSITASFTATLHRGCAGDIVTVTSTTANATGYSWDFGDGSPAVTTPNATHTYAAGSNATYTITLTCTNISCTTVVTNQIDTRHALMAGFVPSPDTFCAYNPVQTTTMINNSSSSADFTVGTPTNTSGGLQFVWNFGDGSPTVSSPYPSTPTHSYVNAGVYQISLSVSDSIDCPAIVYDTVYALGVTINSWHDTTLCLKQPLPLDNVVTLFPPVTSDFTYSWTQTNGQLTLDSLNVDVPSLTGFGSDTNILTADANGSWGACYAIDTMIVNSVLGQVLTNVTTSEVIPYGSSIQLNSDNEVFYYWIPDNGSLNNPNINNPVATPLVTTTYTVYGMDQYGCVDSAFVTITVDSTMNESIPTAFTPNGDGLNDIFRPVGVKFQNVVEFRVFNRWGQQVFYSNTIEHGWDGTFNGVPQDVGVYSYLVIVARPGGGGENVVYKGNVTLIR